MSLTIHIVCVIVSILSTILVPLAFVEDLYISPTVDGHCPSHPCYTLLEAFENATQIFTSNTTVNFPASTFRVSVGKAIIIQDVNNLSLTGGGNSRMDWTKTDQLSKNTVIVCDADVGIIFINVTDLLIHKFHFVHCGTPLPSKVLADYFMQLPLSFAISYSLARFKPSLAFIHIHSMRISDIAVSNNSVGPGILGINIFGSSSVREVICLYNEPNSIFLFVASTITVPFHNFFHISNSVFSSDPTPIADLFRILDLYTTQLHAAGLSIVLEQTTYNVHVALHDVKLQNNGRVNLFLIFWRCCMCGNIWIDGLDISGASLHQILFQAIDYPHFDYHCKCTFQNNTLQLRNTFLHSSAGNGIELKNSCRNKSVITIKNLTAYNIGLAIRMETVSVFLQEDFNITNTLGVLAYKSNIEFEGVSYFINNSGESAVNMRNSNVIFGGRTVFTRNRGKRAGAIYARSSRVTFSGELQFIENQGYNGGGLALHGSFMSLKWNAKAVFLRNHARHYGGALYVSYDITTELNIDHDIPICFFKVDHEPSYPNISFKDNTAISAGSAIYGGSVDICHSKL